MNGHWSQTLKFWLKNCQNCCPDIFGGAPGQDQQQEEEGLPVKISSSRRRVRRCGCRGNSDDWLTKRRGFWTTQFLDEIICEQPLISNFSGAKEHGLNLCKLKLYTCLPDLFIEKILKRILN